MCYSPLKEWAQCWAHSMTWRRTKDDEKEHANLGIRCHTTSISRLWLNQPLNTITIIMSQCRQGDQIAPLALPTWKNFRMDYSIVSVNISSPTHCATWHCHFKFKVQLEQYVACNNCNKYQALNLVLETWKFQIWYWVWNGNKIMSPTRQCVVNMRH